MGPQTEVTGSAFSMRSNLVRGYFAQNSPQDRENLLFGVFGPFWAPGGREISLSPPDPQKQVNRELLEKFLENTHHRQGKKVAQSERSPDEPKSS